MRTISSFTLAFVRRVALSAAVASALLLTLGAAPRAVAHPTGRLKLASKTLHAGDSLAIGGERFATSDEVTLVLVGVTGRVELGAVPTDTAGAFQHTFFVARSAKEGQYQLVAEAIDGDPVATVDVVVQGPSMPMSMGAMPSGSMPEGMAMDARPSGEPLQLVRATSAAVRWSARLFVLACALAGALLLRRDPHTNPKETHT